MKTKNATLTPIQKLLIAKFDAGDARDHVYPGTYEDEFNVSVVGKLTVGEDYDSRPTVPWEKIACFLLSNYPGRVTKRLILEALTTEVDPEMSARVKDITQGFSEPRTNRGRVNGAVVVRLLEEEK
jgi:hypothetical protein